MGKLTLTNLRIPISVILSWPKANYVNPTRRTWAVPLSISLTALATLLIAARIFARITRRAGRFGIDDALILVAWSCTLAYTTLMNLLVSRRAAGLHTWDVKPQMSVWGGKLGFATFLLLVWANLTTKISILLFHRRIVASLVGITVAQLNICKPISAFWEGLDVTYHDKYTCWSLATFDISTSFILLSSDLLTLGIPLLVISRLNLPRLQKIMLTAVFGCGIIAVAAGGLRVHYAWNLFHGNYDAAWASFDMFVWVEIELQLAMMCASVPALKGFLSNSLRDRSASMPPHEPRKAPKVSSLPSFVRAVVSNRVGGTADSSRSDSEEIKTEQDEPRITEGEEIWGMEEIAITSELKNQPLKDV